MPKADIQEFQKEYFMSFGTARAYQQLIDELRGAEDRQRQIAQRIEQENVKKQIATTPQSR